VNPSKVGKRELASNLFPQQPGTPIMILPLELFKIPDRGTEIPACNYKNDCIFFSIYVN
jgi:hypothetical protein